MYKILEARVEYKNNNLERITVLVEVSRGDVRAIEATTKQWVGYMHIQPAEQLSTDLLLEVAAYGMETGDRDKIFPGWKKKFAIAFKEYK
jgi:hypothetical protein